jgi:hypothetical protein
VKIYTCYSREDTSAFKRLKRKKWTGWKFLFSGEWAESPMNQGRCKFYITSTLNKQYWAIMEWGFPKRIIAVAQVQNNRAIEHIAAEMLSDVRRLGGDYIDLVHQHGDIDIEQCWHLYTRPETRNTASKAPIDLFGTKNINPYCDLIDSWDVASHREKYLALGEALKIILKDNHLMRGDQGYQIIRDSVASMIDRLGPEKALEEVKRTKAHLIAQAARIAELS